MLQATEFTKLSNDSDVSLYAQRQSDDSLASISVVALAVMKPLSYPVVLVLRVG